MEQYLLCVLNSALSEKDYTIITSCLETLLPTSFQCQYASNFNKSVAVLLNPISKHIAVLKKSDANENVSWKLLDEDINILDTVEEDASKRDSGIGLNSHNAVECLAAALHSLADQLPMFGTYRLDILLASDVLKELSVCKESVLAGAFIRLTRWHSAHFTIFEQQDLDKDRLNEWCEIMDVQILLQNSKLDLGPPLWRGAVQIESTDSKVIMNGFQLRLDLHENVQSIFHTVENNTKFQNQDNVILSSKLILLEEISFTSIPPYLISPVIFRLHINNRNILNEDASNLIEYLSNNEKAAFIGKLEYGETNEKIKSDRRYYSNRWQKAAFSGYIKDAECFLSSFEESISFAITKSNNSNHIVAYPLRDPKDLNANFYFDIINTRITNFIQDPKNINELELPLIDGSVCQEMLLDYCVQSMEYKIGSNDCQRNTIISNLFDNLKKSAFCPLGEKSCSSDFLCEEIDPSDWPERMQLLDKQIQSEEEKDYVPVNASLIQNLKLPQQSFCLSSENIVKYFCPSGEHKSLRNCENIYPINNSDHPLSCNLSDVLKTNWPEIISCFYHDLYYNSSYQAEDKESLGSQIVNLYVQHETSSTCNNQQITQNSQIIVSEKVFSPSKAFRGPSTRETNISNKKGHERNISPRKNSLKDLITKKILSASGLHSDNHKINERHIKRKSSIPIRCSPRKKNPVNYSSAPVRCSPRKKNPINYSSAPVRCSPRKKNPVNCKYTTSYSRSSSSTSNSIEARPIKSNHSSESNKMSDLLRKKLRCAVAVALEKNGINCNHPQYNKCGSKLFKICQAFLDDLKLKKGKTSEYLQDIANSYVEKVIEHCQKL